MLVNGGVIIHLISLLLIQQVIAGGLFSNHQGKNQADVEGWNIVEDQPLDGDALKRICSDSSLRISKVSTVGWLLQQFESSTNDYSLDQCRLQYLKPLRALNKVISSHVDDVCSLDKVKLIDQFQWDYQMGSISKKWMRYAKGALPEPLKLFFVHYVNEITNSCKLNLAQSLEVAASQQRELLKKPEAFASPTGSFGRIVDSLRQILIPKEGVKHYDDFVLLWDMLIKHEHKKGKEIAPMKDPTSGEVFLACVRVKDASSAWEAQEKCRQQLKPVYQDTILPVMKLIDMGYGGTKNKQLDEQIKGNDELKYWYTLTQTCELLMVLKFYEDKSMKFWDMGFLNPLEAISKFDGAKPVIKMEEQLVEFQVRTPPVSQSNELKSTRITSDETKLVKLVKTNAKNRSHLFRRVLKNIMINAMNKNYAGHKHLVSIFKKLKRSNNQNKQRVDDEKIFAETLKETDKFLMDEEKHSGDGKALLRPKRKLNWGDTLDSFIILAFVAVIVVAIWSCATFIG